MRPSILCYRTIRRLASVVGALLSLAGALLSVTGARTAFGQYQDTSAESARGFSNNRVQANISDQGSGYGPAPYGPYGPYYSRRLPLTQNRAQSPQTGGLPNPGIALPSNESLRAWYRSQRPKVDGGVIWVEEGARLLAAKVTDDSELSRLGLRVGDELVNVDGYPVHSLREWQQVMGSVKSGHTVLLAIRHDGQLAILHWSVGAIGLEESADATESTHGGTREAGSMEFITAARLRSGGQGRARLGVVLDRHYDDRAVVGSVEKGSAAAEAGLLPGDVVVSLSGRTIGSPDELIRLVAQAQPGSTVALYVERPGITSAGPAGGGDLPLEPVQ
jgi:PDZ domain